MQCSSLAVRPRQRTSTSCTECRRRKQKCNQAKNRPCNNCVRRYPPVACTYESSSRGSTVERIIDLQEGSDSRDDSHHSDNHASVHQSSTPGYASQAGGSAYASQDKHFPSPSPSYYAPLDSTTDYWQQQDDPWSSQNLNNSTSNCPFSEGYYQTQDDYSYDPYSSFTTSAQSYLGYYSTADVPNSGWPSYSGAPSPYASTSNGYDPFNDLPVDTTGQNEVYSTFFYWSFAPIYGMLDDDS